MHITTIHKKALHEIPYLAVGGGGKHLARKRLPVLQATVRTLPQPLAGLMLTADLQGFDPDSSFESVPPTQLGHTVAQDLWLLAEQKRIPPIETLGFILAGDLYVRPGKRGGLGDVSEIWQAFSGGRWLAGVLGNHDAMEGGGGGPSSRWHLLDGAVVEQDGLRIGGVSGVVGDPSRTNRRPAADFFASLDAVLAKRPDLLILHQGPTPISGRSKKGLPEVRERLRQVDYDLLVTFGHEHWKQPLEQLTPSVQLLNVHERVVLVVRNETR